MLRLNATPLDRSNGGAIASIQYGGGGMVTSYRPSRLALAQNQFSRIQAVSGGEATIALESAGAVISVAIEGYTYTLSEGENSPGTFSWNRNVGTLTLHLVAGHQPSVGTTAIVQLLSDRYTEGIPTGEVLDPAPEWFTTWSAQGSFQWSRSFTDQPSGRFSFTTVASHELEVRSRLQNGTKLVAYGMGFSVAGLSITRLSEEIYPGRYIQVEVSLTGYWVKELEKPVRLKRSAYLTSGGTPQATATVSRILSLSEIARAAGAVYSGLFIDLNSSVNATDAEQTTLGAEVGNRALSVNGFPFYSEPESVQVRSWRKTRLHVLGLADLLSPVQIAIGGKWAHFTAQQQDNLLSDEYRNMVLTLDRNTKETDHQQNLSQWVTDEDNFCESPPEAFSALVGQLTLENLSNNHDSGGVTKERSRTLYRNGTVLKVIKEKFGFAYRGIDVYRYSASNPSSTSDPVINWYRYNTSTLASAWWQKVEESTESYNYDPTTGYLLSVITQSRKYSRLKQEQDARETIAAETMPTVYANGVLIKDGNALRAAYRFNWVTETDTTTNTLESFLGLYPDVTRPKDNADWIEPKYCVETKRTSAQTIQGIAIEPSKPAPLAGRAFTDSQRIIVNYPYRGISRENWSQEQEMFTVRSQTQNQQGENLQDSLKIGHRTENRGRPSTHTQIAIVRTPAPPSARTAGQQQAVKALLNTPNNGLTIADPSQGNVSFPGVFDYAKGRECAQTQISIANTKNVETWKFTVRQSVGKDYQEGDRLSLMGKLLVILAIDAEYVIHGSLIVCEGISISAGLFLNPPVTLTYDAATS